MRLGASARLFAGLLLCAAAVACADAPAAPEDVAQQYLTAYWADDYEVLYDLVAPTERRGESEAEWVKAAERVDSLRTISPTPRQVAEIELQLTANLAGRRQYEAVLTFPDGTMVSHDVTLVQTDEGWRAVR